MEPTRLEGKVDKGWGYELIWATNDLYCGKIMVFEKVSKIFEYHLLIIDIWAILFWISGLRKDYFTIDDWKSIDENRFVFLTRWL